MKHPTLWFQAPQRCWRGLRNTPEEGRSHAPSYCLYAFMVWMGLTLLLTALINYTLRNRGFIEIELQIRIKCGQNADAWMEWVRNYCTRNIIFEKLYKHMEVVLLLNFVNEVLEIVTFIEGQPIFILWYAMYFSPLLW